MGKLIDKFKSIFCQSYYDRNFRKKDSPRYSRSDKLVEEKEVHKEESSETNNKPLTVRIIVRAEDQETYFNLLLEVAENELYKKLTKYGNVKIQFVPDINPVFKYGVKANHPKDGLIEPYFKDDVKADSFYQIAKAYGFTGSPREFLNWIAEEPVQAAERKIYFYKADYMYNTWVLGYEPLHIPSEDDTAIPPILFS